VRATPPDAFPNPLAHDLRPSPGAGEQRADVDQGHDLYRPAAAGPPDRDRVICARALEDDQSMLATSAHLLATGHA
jgi:hypothetical protein